MKTELEIIDEEISAVRMRLGPLMRDLENLLERRRLAASLEFIRVNQIRREDVEMVEGEGKPYFGQLGFFVSWLKRNSNKRWAEWNGRIYHTSDFLAGMMPETPGRICDLKD